MSITDYLGQKTEDLKIRNYLTNFREDNKINLLEYTYLLQYTKKMGTLININWFIEILNRLDDFELLSLIKDTYFFFTKNTPKLDIDKNLIISDICYKNNILNFTDDQKNVIKLLIHFFTDYNETMFGLFGYAGTGKTTIIVELVSFLLKEGYIKNVAFTAPTNKAVNIMKAKFRQHIKEICAKKLNKNLDSRVINVDDILDELNNIGIKIEFMTLHRLLNYKNNFNVEGDRVFIRSPKASMKDYELIIIDECSMVTKDMVENIKTDISDKIKNKGANYQNIPKVVFLGDPAQLPPVNEISSYVFDPQITSTFTTFTMKSIVRNKIDNVINLCYNIRQWIDKEVEIPHIKTYKGDGVCIYNLKKHTKKIDSKWFQTCIKYINTTTDAATTSNIILTWTNRQADEYNNTIRKLMFKNKETIDKFEQGDILMLNDFYTLDEACVTNRFYTSEQIKVVDIERFTKKYTELNLQLSKTALRIKNINHIEIKYKNMINQINKKTKRMYQLWILHVNRLSESNITNTIPITYDIYVLDEASFSDLQNDKFVSTKLIQKFRHELSIDFKEQMNQIDTNIIRPLWKEWNKIFVEPFANVNYGYAQSVHKSQGSTFFNVFMDLDDILNNTKNPDEAKRCVYVAATRTSNSLHILL